MKKLASFIFAAALAVFTIGCSDSGMNSSDTSSAGKGSDIQGKSGQTLTYLVTLENLTPATGPGASQPFSPPILATHKTNYRVFHIGGYASDALEMVAEDAANDDLIDMLEGSNSVYDVAAGDGVILPDGSASFTIEAKVGYHKLSLVTMLVNTNDGFVGADKINLPLNGSKTYYLRSYDAGTEMNTELTEHIPGPCCGNAFAGEDEHEKISYHPGITGSGDLDPATYDWDEPAAKLTITLQ